MSVALFIRALALALAAMALNLLGAFAWLWVYSLVIAPGHDAGFYQSYAVSAGPICDIMFAIPLLFGAGWLMGRHYGLRGAATLLAAYLLLEAAILAAAAGSGVAFSWPIALVSGITKAAAVLGGWKAAYGWESPGA